MNKFIKYFVDFLHKHSAVSLIFAYILITLIFTFPLVLKINSQIPQGRGDVFQAVSNIESRSNALAHINNIQGKSIFLAKNINTYLPYVVLNQIFNKYISYNLLFLLSFMLSGIGMYLLAFYFTKNKIASFLAGVIFAFSPFHYYESTVVNLGTMHQEWLPFFVLFLFKFFEEFKFKYFVLASFFAFLIAMTEHQFLAFTMLFVGAFFVFKFIEDKTILKNKKLWCYIGIFVSMLVFAAFTIFAQLLKIATSDNNFLDPGINAASKYSMGVFDIFLPTATHSIWSVFQFIFPGFFDGRVSYFTGFTVLAVIIYYFVSLFKAEKFKHKVFEIWHKQKDLSFWLIATLLFYFFSLGPSFSIGKYITIYLPYFLVYKLLPFYSNIRTTGRMYVFVLLGFSMLFAYAYKELSKKYFKKLKFSVIVFSLIMLEFWVAPIATMSVSYSKFYDAIAKDSEAYKLIEIPGSTNYEFASYELFLSTIHKKTVLNGMPLARKISGEFEMQQNTPVIKQLLYTIPKGNDPDQKDMSDVVPRFDWNAANDLLSYYNVRYVTISKRYAKPDIIKLEEKFIQSHISFSDRYEDQYLVAYKIKQKQPEGYITLLDSSNDNYSELIFDKNGQIFREFGDGSRIKFLNLSNQSKSVKITVNVKGGSQGLMFSVGDNKKINLSNNFQEYAFETMLNPGENFITFSVKNNSGSPISITGKKKIQKAAIISKIIVDNN